MIHFETNRKKIIVFRLSKIQYQPFLNCRRLEDTDEDIRAQAVISVVSAQFLSIILQLHVFASERSSMVTLNYSPDLPL